MKEKILNTVADLVENFLYYDRKEDEDLGVGDIQNAIKDGLLTKEEIVEHFKGELYKQLEGA